MDLARIAGRLPATWQRALLARGLRDGSVFELPVVAMLLRSLETFGATVEELEAAFRAPLPPGSRRGETFPRAALLGLGERLSLEGQAFEASGESESARESYLRSAIYQLTADWLSLDEKEMAEDYRRALPAFDAYRRLCDPPAEKVCLPFDGLSLFAHFRSPRGASGRPVLIILQGNDEVKEFNTRIEEAALALGFSVLDLDPPGWGESHLAGTRCRGREDYAKAIGLAVDCLAARPEVDPRSIGVLGLSFGGLLSPFAAGLEPRIAAAVGLGGPSWSTAAWRSVRSRMPALQRRRSYLFSGARNEASLLAWWEGMRFRETLGRVRVPVLLVHGEEDELVSPEAARENADAIGDSAELRVVRGGDHLCNATLLSETLPAMLLWLSGKLEAGHDMVLDPEIGPPGRPS